MEGVVNILKELLGSKLTCSGVCFTTAAMHFGPRYTEIPALPADWRWVPFVVMLFTGFICAWWLLQATPRVCKEILRLIFDIFFPPSMDDLLPVERQMLAFAEINGGSFTLNHFTAYENSPDHIEASVALTDLKRKGLLVTYPGPTHALTHAGKEFILMHREPRSRQP